MGENRKLRDQARAAEHDRDKYRAGLELSLRQGMELAERGGRYQKAWYSARRRNKVQTKVIEECIDILVDETLSGDSSKQTAEVLSRLAVSAGYNVERMMERFRAKRDAVEQAQPSEDGGPDGEADREEAGSASTPA